MNISKQLITVEIATALLSNNKNNRRIKDPIVNRYASEMIAGRWKQDTAEFIKIFKDGEIGDGQHRLHAVIKSAIPTWFHVAVGIDKSVMDVLDTGTTRSAQDVFKIAGIKNESLIPPVISLLHILKTNAGGYAQKNQRLTHAMILEEYKTNTEYWQLIAKGAMANYHSFSQILAPTQIGAFTAYFDQISKEDSANFMRQLCTGSGIERSAVLLLRNKLIGDKNSIKKIPAEVRYAYIIKSWNSFRSPQKDQIKILRYCPAKDDFPIAI